MSATYLETEKGIEIKTPSGRTVTVNNLLQAYTFARMNGLTLKEQEVRV